MINFNRLKSEYNWFSTAIISILINFGLLVWIIFSLASSPDLEVLNQKIANQNLDISIHKSKIEKRDKEIEVLKQEQEKNYIELDSLKYQNYIKTSIINTSKNKRNEKIIAINKYSVSDMQSMWNDRYKPNQKSSSSR